jgi:serine/threonine protein kinase
LQDMLPVLDFIHHQGVIHRDIKPVNVIRRAADQKLVLIDFGIAKKISTQMAESDPHTKFTIGLGTQGYMPSEQAAGMPNFTSDIYALGITAIEALTGTPPHQFQRDGSGQIIWSQQPIGMSPELEHILRKMVHHDYSQRYQSAQEVIKALEQLPEFTVNEFYKAQLHEEVEKPSELKTLDELGDLDADTQLWQSE